jgi:hypothetical protein
VHLPGRVVTKYADLVKQEIPATDISLLEILRIYSLPAEVELQELINILEPIAPRLYSIASSMQSHTDEIHITVSKNKFKVNGEWKFGLCSDFLSCQPLEAVLNFIYIRITASVFLLQKKISSWSDREQVLRRSGHFLQTAIHLALLGRTGCFLESSILLPTSSINRIAELV